MLGDNQSVRDTNHLGREAASFRAYGRNATSPFDVIRALTTKSDEVNLLNKSHINRASHETDFLHESYTAEINDGLNLQQVQKVLYPFKKVDGTSFKLEVSQEFAKVTDHMQEVSPDTGSCVEEPNINTKWEDKFRQWSKPLSKEAQKNFGRAERAIRRAILQDVVLSKLDVGVFTKSSYRSGMSNEFSSDLDMKVTLWEPLLHGHHTFRMFRKLVENALIHQFGRENIERGNNALHIKKNVFKLEVDILAEFAYQRYMGRYKKNGTKHSVIETEFYSNDGRCIIAQHEEGYANLTEKHKRTNKRYKRVVRILKRLRDEMKEANIEVSKKIPSQLIETMIYYVPDKVFSCEHFIDIIKNALECCISHTRNNEGCKEWRQLYNTDNQGKFRSLFGDDRQQPWSREQAHEFLLAAKDYIGFESSSRNDANAERLSEIRPQLEEQVEKLKEYIVEFNKYSIKEEEPLSDVLKSFGADRYHFKALVEKAPSYCKEIQYHLKADVQDLGKLESYYQSLQRINQGLDMIHKRLLEKLMPVGSSAEKVDDLGTELRALFGMNREAIGNIEREVKRKGSQLEHKERKNHYRDKKLYNHIKNIDDIWIIGGENLIENTIKEVNEKFINCTIKVVGEELVSNTIREADEELVSNTIREVDKNFAVVERNESLNAGQLHLISGLA